MEIRKGLYIKSLSAIGFLNMHKYHLPQAFFREQLLTEDYNKLIWPEITLCV